MKTTSRVGVAALLFSFASPFCALARPIEFSEVSLLVRAHEPTAALLQTVRERRLAQPISAAQQNVLRAQGADDVLLRSLRDSNLALSPAETAAFAAGQDRAGKSRPAAATSQEESSVPQVRIIDVAYGHPVNLSQWGGPSEEIAFQIHRYAGEDVIEPVVGDAYTLTATYRGQGRPDDQTTIFDRRDYVSSISYDHSRRASIDMENPVSIKGVPYLLYPVSGAGGVGLYYIGKSGGSVRLAVVSTKA